MTPKDLNDALTYREAKQNYIDNYLQRKMKNHNMSYGIQYHIRLNNLIEKAERLWNLKQKRNARSCKRE
jgi:hypothetical protein